MLGRKTGRLIGGGKKRAHSEPPADLLQIGSNAGGGIVGRPIRCTSGSKVTLETILDQPSAKESWNKAVELRVPTKRLAELLESIANQCLPPRPRRFRRRQVEAFAERFRQDAIIISHLNILHSDDLPGPRPPRPSLQFDRLLSANPGWHLLLPEMLTHYADKLDRLGIGKPRPETPKQRSQKEEPVLEGEVVHLFVVASAGVGNGAFFSGEAIDLRPSYRYQLAANLIQAAYDAGGVNRSADADNLRKDYARRTLHYSLKKKYPLQQA